MASSGTQWLGDLPGDWQVQRFGRVFDVVRRPPRSTDGNVTAYRDGQVTLRSNRRVDGYTEADKEIGYQGIRDGDLVIHSMDAFAGAIGVSDSNGKSSPVYLACVPRFGHSSAYFARVLRHIALSGYIASLGKGVRERSTDFRWSDAREVLVPVPPVHEQRDIAAYLDRETGKIDTLIAKQEQLVITLTERSEALISSAVSRGITKDIRLAATGDRWFDELPAHWTLRALKRLVSTPITDGPHETPEFVDEGVEFISAEAVSGGVVDFDKKRGFISREADARYSLKYRPKLHDIYMIKSGATTGRTAMVTELRHFNIWSPLAAIRVSDEMDPFFVHFALRSNQFQTSITLAWTFGTQQNIGMGSLGDLKIPTPPIVEQRRIVSFLAPAVGEMESLTSRARSVIGLLRERRQALISAAVTGKIDVRGL